MKKLRFGIIGAGGIADRRTLPGMLLAKNVEIVAVMEVNPEFSQKLRAKYNAKYAFTTAEQVVACSEVDAVYIASPVVFHASQAKLAADYGKHILIEKPIAMNVTEGEEVVEYCAKKGVKIAAGFMMRFGSHVVNMKKAVSEGKIGKVVSAYSQFTSWFPYEEGNWRQDKSKGGGGCLIDMGVHCIDLIEYVTGARVVEVCALNEPVYFEYTVEDSSTVLLKMSDGNQAVVQTNFNIPDEVAKWRLEFFGTKGRLMGDGVIGQVDGGTLNFASTDQIGYNAAQDQQVLAGENLPAEFGNMYTREVESFADSVLNDKPLEVPASDAVHIQKVVSAAYESSEKHVFVKVEN